MSDLRDVTVIGGGPVGLFAAFYAGLRGMSVRILDSLPELGGQLAALYPEKYVYDMPGFPQVLAKDLAKEMAAQGLQFDPEVVLGSRAETLDQVGGVFQIGLENGETHPSKTVIIAAGAGAFTPTKLGVDREDEFHGSGLMYGVRSVQELRGKRLAIVGGGDSALDWALALEPHAEIVHLIHRRDQFRAHEDSVEKVKRSRVELKLFQTIKELHGEGAISGVTLEHTQSKETEHLPVDAVIVNVGFKSNLGPLKDWGFDLEKSQIVVDNKFETKIEGIYAVGDVCVFPGKLKLIATGVGEAATAVCYAKQRIDPEAKLFPGHSSDRDPSAKG